MAGFISTEGAEHNAFLSDNTVNADLVFPTLHCVKSVTKKFSPNTLISAPPPVDINAGIMLCTVGFETNLNGKAFDTVWLYLTICKDAIALVF